MGLQDMFWGGYFGSLRDRYGGRWMFNCAEPAGRRGCDLNGSAPPGRSPLPP
jgi:hypothetical protein